VTDPWDHFLDEDMARLPDHVVVALEHGPVAPTAIASLPDGYAVLPDHGIEVAVRTFMPGVTPAMWDWWFGWHGSHDSRYRLWHPRAHVSAQWADGVNGDAADADPRRGRARYVGRTSHVVEYLGSTLVHGAIRFVPPGVFGLHEARPDRGTAICAVLGSSQAPVDIGRLVHEVRRVDGGSEMRSRFWLGGRRAELRRGTRLTRRASTALLSPFARRTELDARALLVHCAQEMNHLAVRLPDLYAELRDD
jgi:hypothetical protein